MNGTENSLNNGENMGIGKKDLQLLLQVKLGKQVVVLKCAISSLLPPGENFACSLYKIHAVIKRDHTELEEDLHLVAKMFPFAEEMKKIFNFELFFKKEIFFYERFIPSLKQLEIDFGTKVEDTFDITPRLFGFRRSKDPDTKLVDDGAMILMENLFTQGYYSLNKINGMDLNHSQNTIKALARFHALGIACKQHRSEFFTQEVLAHAKVVPFHDSGDIFGLIFEKLCKDPHIRVHREHIQRCFTPEMRRLYFEYVAEEPWPTVVHLDLWTNNILNHKNTEDSLDGIKFIDFQNYSYNSPMRDITYFLLTSTTHEVMTEHLDELIDLYYETFIETLMRMRCDVGPFGREAFETQLKIDAAFEFFHCIIAIKFFCAEIDKITYDPSQIESVVLFSDINEVGYQKWYNIVITYIKKGWL